jgi:hypothetical protein
VREPALRLARQPRTPKRCGTESPLATIVSAASTRAAASSTTLTQMVRRSHDVRPILATSASPTGQNQPRERRRQRVPGSTMAGLSTRDSPILAIRVVFARGSRIETTVRWEPAMSGGPTSQSARRSIVSICGLRRGRNCRRGYRELHAHSGSELRLALIQEDESGATVETVGVRVRRHFNPRNASEPRGLDKISHQASRDAPAHPIRVHKQVLELQRRPSQGRLEMKPTTVPSAAIATRVLPSATPLSGSSNASGCASRTSRSPALESDARRKMPRSAGRSPATALRTWIAVTQRI